MQSLWCPDRSAFPSSKAELVPLCSGWEGLAVGDAALQGHPQHVPLPTRLIPFGAAAGQANSFAFSCSLRLTQNFHLQCALCLCPALPRGFMPFWGHALLSTRAQSYGFQQSYQHSSLGKPGRSQAGPDIIYVRQRLKFSKAFSGLLHTEGQSL